MFTINFNPDHAKAGTKKARQKTGFDKTIVYKLYSVSIPRLTVPEGVIIVAFWNSELAFTLR